MPEKKTTERVQKDKRAGKSPSTQAGEFVREEMEHIREGKHGARSTKQAIAIGLSKARRAGVKLPPPKNGKTSARKRRGAENGTEKRPSAKRSRAALKALRREGHAAASHRALSRHAHGVGRQKTATQRSAAAKRAARSRAQEQSR